MKKIITLLFLLTMLVGFSQSNFEYGYYIDQSGNKIVGEISQLTLNNFPDSFIFRVKGKEEKVGTQNVSSIKYGTLVFEKKTFTYDATQRLGISNMPKQKDFQETSKTAFVQLIVNGDIKLYKYLENDIPTFFYETSNNEELITLKYKKYIAKRNEVFENREFTKQLKELESNKNNKNEGYYRAVKYNDEDLVDYFVKNNGKSAKAESKSSIRFNFFVGYAFHNTDIGFISNLNDELFKHFTVAPELEFIINKSKRNPLSVFLNSKYHKFKKGYSIDSYKGSLDYMVDIHSVFSAIGMKKYLLSTDNMSPYLKAGFGFSKSLKSKMVYPSGYASSEILNNFSAGINVGIGSMILSGISFEIDYDYLFKDDFLDKNTSINLKLGYSF